MENYLNISVILPIKNNKEKDFVEFFGKSIESLQIQEVQPKELVIVHTGDETLVEFLNSYDFKELNVKVLKYELILKEAHFELNLIQRSRRGEVGHLPGYNLRCATLILLGRWDLPSTSRLRRPLQSISRQLQMKAFLCSYSERLRAHLVF